MSRFSALPESKFRRGRWEWPALAEGLSSVFRLLPVMHDASLPTRTTLFHGTRQHISSRVLVEAAAASCVNSEMEKA